MHIDCPDDRDRDAVRLERDGLMVLPGQPFMLADAEAELVSPRFSDGRAKNISLGAEGGVRGAAPEPEARTRLATLMSRYRTWSERAVAAVAPRYVPHLERGRTSLRTREVAGGPISKRKDDRRLHIDAFPSEPTGGRRILRVFSNINAQGEPRLWQVGEPFEDHARVFARRLRAPWPAEGWLLHRIGVTRARRTAYDTMMLSLHDASKLDDAYQSSAARREAAFPAGTSWIVFTDSTVHAAIRGRHLLEQTFYLPIHAMAARETAPAHILERITGRRLI
jgi:hypothetical protein